MKRQISDYAKIWDKEVLEKSLKNVFIIWEWKRHFQRVKTKKQQRKLCLMMLKTKNVCVIKKKKKKETKKPKITNKPKA